MVAPACPASSSSDHEPIETRCDGVDNDCDGLVDKLLPLAANGCELDCGAGMASCQGRERVCLAQASGACNGIEPHAAQPVRPRALLFVTTYLQREGGAEIDTYASILEQWGIPYDRLPMLSFEEQLLRLSDDTLAIIPGYVEGAFLTDQRVEKLQRFVEQGGVLIAVKPILPQQGPGGKLLGLSRSQARKDTRPTASASRRTTSSTSSRSSAVSSRLARARREAGRHGR